MLHLQSFKRSIPMFALVAFVIGIAITANCRSNAFVETINISGILAEKTRDDLLKESTLIITGSLTEISTPFQLETATSDTSNFRDYTFQVSRTMKGEADRSIKVRLHGGQVGNINVVVEDNPILEHGKEYLLFLYQPNMGGGFNTTDNVFYLLGLPQGVYEKSGETTYLCDMNGDEIDISAIPSTLADEPINTDYFKEQYLHNLQTNLESGFLTQDEYDRALADMDNYAEVK